MFLLILATCTLAADQQAGDNGPDAPRLLARMKASRDSLKSGAYRARGKMVTNGDGDEEPVQGDVAIFSAFDFDKGLLRFDHTRPVLRRIDGDAVTVHDTSKYVRTPDSVITWLSPWQLKDRAAPTWVGIHPPTIEFRHGPFTTLDVRTLGLCVWDDLWVGVPFSTSFETWDKSPWIETEPEANGLHRLRLLEGHRRDTFLPQTLWLDERRGFSPIRLSYSVLSLDADRSAG